MDRREAEAVIARLRRVPDRFRAFTAAAEDVLSTYGMDDESVARLVELGLPRRRSGGVETFDRRDLANAALHLGFSSVQRRAFDAVVRSLGLADGASSLHAVVDCIPARVAGPPAGELTLRLPGSRGVALPYRAGRPAARLVKALTGHSRALPPPVRDLLSSAAVLDFWLLPDGLRADTSFTRASGLSDCVVSSRLVQERCRELGLRARRRFGLLLSQPFSMTHSWTEVWCDGEWAAVDPLLLATLARHAGLSPTRWPVERPLTGVVLGFAAAPRDIASCSTSPVRLSLPTRFTQFPERVGAGDASIVWTAPTPASESRRTEHSEGDGDVLRGAPNPCRDGAGGDLG